ncbi:MAG TPA: thiamine pyrophosphate-binding protein [Thermomicrobiales bacterium]|nr:thiamine pyrophosphate-binding protein [Thermomicrobiales bacterium]
MVTTIATAAATTRMTGGQAVVRALEAQGVEVAFGIPGVHTLAIYDALVDSGIEHVLGRHEQGVGFMADGYARASGKPAVALIITGPGVTNVATAVAEAYTESTPLLVIASAEERRWLGKMAGNYHDITDQIGVMRPITGYAAEATSVEQITGLVGEAFRSMSAGRSRPAYVEIPRDLLEQESTFDIVPARPVAKSGPAPEAIAEAVAAIQAADKVVIYAGGGAVAANAAAGLVALAERLGAPVVTSQLGKGAIPEDHPYALGNLWERDNAVGDLLRSADLALVFGSKLGVAETESMAMPLPRRLIRIDIDPVEVGRHYPPTQAIVADARLTVEALTGALEASGVSKRGWTADQVAETRARALAASWGAENAPYLAALRRAIPREGILVGDTTMMTYLAARRYPVYAPRTWLVPTGYLTLGFALPAALGAKVAKPGTPVVAMVGDGGFQFTMHELATAVQFRLPVPIVIFNDSTYTAVKMDQAMKYDRRYLGVDLVNPDFLQLAAAYGIPAERAGSPEALEAAVTAALGRDLPTIIDVPISWQY